MAFQHLIHSVNTSIFITLQATVASPGFPNLWHYETFGSFLKALSTRKTLHSVIFCQNFNWVCLNDSNCLKMAEKAGKWHTKKNLKMSSFAQTVGATEENVFVFATSPLDNTVSVCISLSPCPGEQLAGLLCASTEHDATRWHLADYQSLIRKSKFVMF